MRKSRTDFASGTHEVSKTVNDSLHSSGMSFMFCAVRLKEMDEEQLWKGIVKEIEEKKGWYPMSVVPE